jgi:hypothetical protein
VLAQEIAAREATAFCVRAPTDDAVTVTVYDVPCAAGTLDPIGCELTHRKVRSGETKSHADTVSALD